MMKGKTGKLARHGRRVLSVFLSVLMLMSAWAIVSPDMFPKAEAATAGNYTITVDGICENDAYASGMEVIVYYKPNNGTGTETSTTIYSRSDNFTWDGTGNDDRNNVSIAGFPTKVEYKVKKRYSVGTLKLYCKIYICGTYVGDTNTEWYNTSGWKTWTWTCASDKYPYANSMSSGAAISGADSLTIPKTGASNVTSNYTNTGTVQDQYGVNWYQDLVYYLASSEPTSVSDVSDSFDTSKASIGGTGTLTLKPACQIAGTTNSVTAWVCAKRGNAWLKKKVTFNDPQYTVTFKNATGGTAKTQNVYYGCAATAPSNPSKNPDSTYHYTWKSWDVAYNNITTDLTVSPTYNSVEHSGGTANCVDKAVCSTCSTAYGSVNATNHKSTLTKTNAVSATCTSAGNNAYWYCASCKKYFSDSAGTTVTTVAAQTIAALGHNPTKIAAVAATCTTAGNNEYYKCTRCNKYFTTSACTTETTVAAQTIPALGHNYAGEYRALSGNKHDRLCTKGCGTYGIGSTEGGSEDCTAASAWSKDASGHWKTCAHCTNIVVAKTNHDKSGWVTTDGTKHWKTCTTCSYSPLDEANHTWEWVTDTAASCTTAGVKHEKCSTCGKIRSENTTIPAAGHTLSKNTNAKSATCTETGLIDTWKCSVCNKIFSDDQGTTEVQTAVVPALGHDFTGAYHNVSSGTHNRKCTRCSAYGLNGTEGATEDCSGGTANCVDKAVCSKCSTAYGSVDASNHKAPENRAAVAATCEDGGYTAGVYCTACEKWVSGHEATQKLGHSLTETAAVENTCEHAGNTAYWTCSRCSKYFSDAQGENEIAENSWVLAKKDHSYTGAFKDNGDGTHSFKCVNGCNQYGGTVSCTYGAWSADNATCVSAGTKTRTCSVCGHVDSQTTAVLPHSFTGAVKSNDDGTHSFKCVNGCDNYGTMQSDVPIQNGKVACSFGAWSKISDTQHSRTCSVCGYEERANHTPQTPGTPTCDDPAICSVCLEQYAGALGHDWNYAAATYSWASDYSVCTAHLKCTRNDQHTIDIDSASVTHKTTKDPTCDDTGIETYTATFTNTNLTTQTTTQTLPIDPTNHNGHIASVALVKATCTTDGKRAHYHCSACGNDYTDATGTTAATDLVIAHTGHNWSDWSVTTPATCVAKGEETRYCQNTAGDDEHEACSAVETRDVEVDPDAHDYGAPSYNWSDDGKTCTATVTCSRNSSHTVTETATVANGQITSAVKTPATCEGKGTTTYTATFTNALFTQQTKDVADIPALGHDFSADNSRANSLENGTHNFKCARCDAYGVMNGSTAEKDGSVACNFGAWTDKDATDHKRTCSVCAYAETAAHDFTAQIQKDAALKGQPDCNSPATYYYSCVDCGRVEGNASHTFTTGDALGHDWDYANAVFNWNGYACATATVTCKRDNTHQKSFDVTVTPATTAADCEHDGQTVYTATFTGEDHNTYTDTKTQVLPASGHAYGTATYTWAADNSSVTAMMVCANDASHKITETVQTSYAVTTAATCEGKGVGTYTATFTNQAFTTQTKNVDIAAIGHAYGTPTYVWAADNSSVTATRVCGNDEHHVETETVSATGVTTDATCLAAGQTVYTSAAFENAAFAVQSKTVVIEQLAHSYTGAVRDNNNGTHSFKCVNGCNEYGGTVDCTYPADWTDNNDGTQSKTCTVCCHKITENISYTLTFLYDGGKDASQNDSSTAPYNKTSTVTLPNVSKTGYTFDGWKVTTAAGNWDADETIASGTTTTSAGKYGDATLTAQWKAADVKYVVNHYKENLDGSIPPTPTVSEELQAKTGTSVTPAVKNYTGFDAPTPTPVTIAADGSTVVNYQYTRKSFTVTLNKGDAGVDSVSGAGTYKYEAPVTVDATAKNGYTFDKWTGDGAPTTKTSNFTMGAANIVWTANTTPCAFKVTFNGNGATGGSVNDQPFRSGVAQNLNENNFEKKYVVTYNYDGATSGNTPASDTVTYTFGGWSETAGGAKVYDDKQSVTLTRPDDVDLQLFAVWTAPANTSVNLPNPSKTGYDFKGWYTDPGKEDKVTGTTFTPDGTDSAITLYAKWEAKSFDVVFAGGGATGGSTATQRFTSDEAQNLNANGFVREYTVSFNSKGGTAVESKTAAYVFDHWSGNGTTYTDGQNVTLASNDNITLTAQWTQASVNLTDAKPTRKGYTFVGWCTDEDAQTTPVGDTFTPKADTVLYAKWTEADTEYTVKHFLQNLENDQYPETPELTETLTALTGSSQTPAVKTYEGFTAPNTQTVTIEADGSTVVEYRYTRNTHTVTLTKDSGISEVTGAGTYKFGATVTLGATVRDGFTWSGWTGDKTLAEQTATFTMGDSDVALKATATAGTYTVNFFGNGATNGSMEPQTFTSDADGVLTANAFEKAYIVTYDYDGATSGNDKPSDTVTYTFDGWSLTANGEQAYADGATVNEARSTPLDLYARWTVENAAVQLPTPEKVGYDFDGWYTDADKTNKVNGSTYEPEESITLHAKWIAKEINVSFNGNGKTAGEMNAQTFTSGTAKALNENQYSRTYTVTFDAKGGTAVAAKTATYTFAGWALSADGDVVYTDQQSATFVSDKPIILYAQWTPGSVDMTRAQTEKTGYTFLGWYKEDTFANKVEGSSFTPEADITLHAKWKANDVDYVVNHYQQNIENDEYTLFKTETLQAKADTNVTPAVKSYEGFTSPSAQTEQVAPDGSTVINYYYDRISFNVTLTAGTGIGSVTGEGRYKYGQTVTYGATVLPGYVWAGWTGTDALAEKNGTFTMPARAVELTATTTADGITLTLKNQNATTAGTAAVYYTYADSHYFDDANKTNEITAITVPAKNGYTFGGYFTEENGGGTKYIDANGDFIGNPNTAITASRELFASWTANDITVTLYGENATTLNTDKVYYTFDTNAYFADTAHGSALNKITPPVRTGWTFIGYFTEKGGNGTQYIAADGAFEHDLYRSVYADTALYAHWAQNSSTLKLFAGDHGTLSDGQMDATYTQSSGAVYTVADPLPADGYTFKDWTFAGDENGTFNAQTKQYTFGALEGKTDTLTANYQTIPYTLTLNYGGGKDGGEATQSTVGYDIETAAALPTLTRTGYTFSGWRVTVPAGNWAANDEVAANASATDVGKYGSATLTAQWTPDAYTVKFDTDGGEAIADLPYNIESTDTLPTAVKTGYTFQNWKVTSNTAGSWTKDETVNSGTSLTGKHGNVTLTAQWQINSSTLKINANGGAYTGTTPVTGEYNTETTLAAPTRNGYTFEGWTLNENPNGSIDGAVYTFGPTNGAEDTATAQWQTIGYMATLEENGGSAVSDISFNVESEPITLPTDISRTGYTFAGWKVTSETGGSWINGAAVTKIDTGAFGDVTLTAQWATIDYTITYTLDGGTATGNPNSYTIESDPITLNAPTKTGYTFAGWTGSNGTEPQTAVTITKGSVGNKNYTANWTANTFTVTYNANGGTGTIAPTEGNYASTDLTFAENAFTREGWHFIAWTENADGSGTQYKAGDPIPATTFGLTMGNTVPVFAQWARNKSTLIVSGGDHGKFEGEAEKSFTNDYQATQVIADATPNNGYTFTGWSLTGNNGTFDAETKTYTFGPTANATDTLTAQYAPIEYTISYDLAGGSVTGNPTTYTIESDDITLKAPNRAGYTFEGWTGTGLDSATKTVTIETGNTGNRSYTATWKTITYTLTYDLAGGSVSGNPDSYTIESAAITLINPTKNGYDFAGWSGTGINGTSKAVTIPTGSTENRTYTANWTPVVYSISYTLNGGTVSGNAETYTIETATFTLINPTKNGYEFAGWTGTGLDSATTEVTIPIGSTDNRTYTATWTPVEYSISYVLDGGSVEGTNPTTYTIESDAITLINPTKTGYDFAGWSGTDINGTSKAVTIPAGSTGNRTYTANWTPVVYSISYTLNGGTVSGNPETYTIETATFTLINPTKTGYEFAGWTGTGLDNATTEVTIEKGSTDNRSYTATWTPVTYTLTYELDGGSDTGNPATYTIESEAITLINPTKTGYTFAGWTGTGLDSATMNVTIVKGSIGDREYTATWTTDPYLITYELAGGTVNGENPTGYNIETADITLINPTKTGYEFAGWTGTGLDNATTAVTIPTGSTGDRSYTATWTPIGYTISYDLKGGALADGATNPTGYNIETPNITLNNPTREGYTFAGWKGTDLDEATMNVIIATGSIGDRSYTATWNVNTFTVVYDKNAEDATGETANTTGNYASDDLTFAENGFTRDGWHFAGWTENADGTGTKYSAGAPIPATTYGATMGNSVTVFALWAPNQSTLIVSGGAHGTYDGEESKTVTDVYGNTFSPIDATPNDGYTFIGWTLNAGANGTYDAVNKTYAFGKAAETQDTLTAQYAKIPYTISYDLAGGATSTENPAGYDVETATFTLNNPTKTGYTFAGWTGSNGETAQKTVTIAKGSTGNRSYKATWTPIGYEISYDLKGGALAEGVTNPADYNIESAEITLNNPSRDGYTFAGWTGTDLADPALSVTIPTGSTEDRAYTATWTPIVYTASFNSDGGTAIESFNYTIEDETRALATDLTKNGYTFSKWVVETADGNWTANADAAEITTGKYGNVTFKAIWTLNTYTIGYDLAGGSATGNPDSYTFEDGDITLNHPTKTGYIFTGWNGTEIADGTMEVVIPTGSFGNRSYTATWTPVTYTVHFDANEGTGAPESVTKTYDSALTLPTEEPTRPGYVFSVWKIGEDQYPAGASVNKDYAAEQDATVTLTAFWNKGNYRVSYLGNVIGDTNSVDGVDPATITITPQDGGHLSTVTEITVDGNVLSPDQYTALVSTNKRVATVTINSGVIVGDVTITVGTVEHSMEWYELDANTCQQRCEICGAIGIESAQHVYRNAWYDSGDGATHYRSCVNCGHVATAAHTGGTATCTEQRECVDCGAKYGDLLGHVLSGTPAVGATCTSRGSIAYWTCANCGKLFADENGTTEITPKDTITDKLPHDFHGEIKNNGDGTHSFACTYGCGTYGSATAHVYDREVATEKYYKSSADCTAPAEYYLSCACGAKGTGTFTGDPIGHNYVSKEGKPATCYDSGYTDYMQCTRCDDTQGKETIAALGHGSYLYDNSASGKVYDGTFEWATYSCSRGCGDHYVLFTVYAKDNTSTALSGATVTITGEGQNVSGTTDRNGVFAPDNHFADGEYTVTISYDNGEKNATTTGNIRVSHGRTSGGIGVLRLVDVVQNDDHSGSSSSKDGFRCSMCDTYEANRSKPVIGIFYTIVHFFVHLIQRIIYAFSRH